MIPFKLPEGAWKCKVCLLMNKKPGATKCAACEAPNPNAPKEEKPASAPTATPIPNVAQLFGNAASIATAQPTAPVVNPFIAAATQSNSAPNPFTTAANAAASNPFLAVAKTANVEQGQSSTATPANPFMAAAKAAQQGQSAAGFDWGAVKTTQTTGTSAFVQQSSAPAQAEKPVDAEESGSKVDKLSARDHFEHLKDYDVKPTLADACPARSSNDVVTSVFGEAKAVESSDSIVAKEVSGHVFTWGVGDCDQLGHGDEEYIQPNPRILKALMSVHVVRVTTGGLHTLAVTDDGKLWSWGCNDDGAIGRKGAENRPGRVRGLLDSGSVVAVAAGDSHSVALDATGRVYAWGTYKGASGYLGFDAVTTKQMEPRLMEAVFAQFGPVVSVSSGADHTIVVNAEGVAAGWGYGAQGQLGRAITDVSLRGNRTSGIHLTPHAFVIPTVAGAKAGRRATFTSPVSGKRKRAAPTFDMLEAIDKLHSKTSVTKVHVVRAFAAGYSTFLVVRYPRPADVAAQTDDNIVERVFASGLNSYGQLGVGDVENRLALEHVAAFDVRADQDGIRNVVSVVGGNQHSIFLRADGTVYVAGRGDSGQLGLTEDRHERLPVSCSTFSPRQINPERFFGVAVKQIAASACTSAAVTADGSVFAWGFGENGQIASGLDKDENRPFCIVAGPKCPSPPERKKFNPAGHIAGGQVLMVALGGQHAVALASNAPFASSVPMEEQVVVEDPAAPVLSDDEDEGGEGGDVSTSGSESDDEGEEGGDVEDDEGDENAPKAKRSRNEE